MTQPRICTLATCWFKSATGCGSHWYECRASSCQASKHHHFWGSETPCLLLLLPGLPNWAVHGNCCCCCRCSSCCHKGPCMVLNVQVAHSSSWLRARASLFVTLMFSSLARSTICLRLRADTSWATCTHASDHVCVCEPQPDQLSTYMISPTWSPLNNGQYSSTIHNILHLVHNILPLVQP